MTQLRSTRVILCVLFGIAVVMGGFTLYVQYVEPLANMFPAVDYTELASPEELLIHIREHLPPGAVPPSAANPRMYRAAGIHPSYWTGFKVNPGDLDDIGAALEASEYQKVPADLEVLPDPPQSILSWWVPANRDVTVWKTELDSRKIAWFLVAEETGEIWVVELST